MKSPIVKVVLVICALGLVAAEAVAEVRNALVIGNGNYQQVGALENPPNDARLMAQTLRDLDFNVIEVIDASQLQMKRAVRDFGTKLNEAGREGVGLFYYAGHGVQVDGANYIIPVDAVIGTEGDVDIESVNANSILSMMEYSNARLSFIVLDACRNNPYSRGFRSATRGLAKMSAPTGSFVAYATSPGDIAVDGSGSNSPYTASLAKHMSKPGVPIEKVFRNVRNEVRLVTSNQQTPWESSSLIGDDYYFKTVVEIETTSEGQEVTVTSTGNDGKSNTVTTGNTNTQGGGVSAATPVVINTPRDSNIELVFWDSVKDSDNPAVLNAYISKYPDGIFVELAKLKIDAMGGLNAEQDLVRVEPAAVVELAKEAQPLPKTKPATSVQPVAPLPVLSTDAPDQQVKLASVAVDPVKVRLNECATHLSSKRLTSGKGGNAYDCYQQILQSEPDHPDALAGMVKIEKTYARWAYSAIDRNNFKKAQKNIDKLRLVNSKSLQLTALDDELAASITTQSAAEKAASKPQKVAVVKKEKAKSKKVAKARGPEKCKAYLDSGQLSGSGPNNAWGCYGAILSSNPDNAAANDGRVNTELAMYKKFRVRISEKDLEGAEKVMRQMRKMNRKSQYYKKMRPWYEELKMENRW